MSEAAQILIDPNILEEHSDAKAFFCFSSSTFVPVSLFCNIISVFTFPSGDDAAAGTPRLKTRFPVFAVATKA